METRQAAKRTPPPPTTRPDPDGMSHLDGVGARAREYVHQAKAPNTRRAYRSDWADFVAWCARYRRSPLPAESRRPWPTTWPTARAS